MPYHTVKRPMLYHTIPYLPSSVRRHFARARDHDWILLCLFFDTVVNGVVWYGVVWCGMVWCGMGWDGIVWYGIREGVSFTQILFNVPYAHAHSARLASFHCNGRPRARAPIIITIIIITIITSNVHARAALEPTDCRVPGC